jgi:hypothetical protein
MAANTSVDKLPLKKAADKLRELVPDDVIKTFEELSKLELRASGAPGFDAAEWLEDVVADRCAGLLAHAKNMQTTFNSLADALIQISDGISDTDTASASNLQGAAQKPINNWISSMNEAATDLPGAEGEANYDSNDNGGAEPELYFEVDEDGSHAEDSDGNVVLDLPDDEGDLARPDLFDSYDEVITEVNTDAESRTDGIHYPEKMDEHSFFSDDHQVVKPDDPEN